MALAPLRGHKLTELRLETAFKIEFVYFQRQITSRGAINKNAKQQEMGLKRTLAPSRLGLTESHPSVLLAPVGVAHRGEVFLVHVTR